MFKKILIANRGEIAVRVIRACREMGIATVAVYSDVDRAALHVRKADEAYHIGPAPAAESYLCIDKILAAARRSGAEAIHPGYGFLSESAKFGQACADAGVKFIGPSPASMEMMGSKTRARQEMEKAGVPFVPGTSRALESMQQATGIAAKIGYPVMLKAAAGGGGKGMRLVHTAEALQPSLEAAQSEAQRAFGDGEVYLEKAILNPRHIEMQVLADEHGTQFISASASVPFSGATRKCWRRLPRCWLVPKCAGAWAKSQSGWPRPPTIGTRARSSFWWTRRKISTSWR